MVWFVHIIKKREIAKTTKKSYKRVPLLPASIYLIMNRLKLKENKQKLLLN